jgi:hypothetical protein
MVDKTALNVSRVEERAHRLARLDGIETAAKVVGTLMSPIAFKVRLQVQFQCAFTHCDFAALLSKKVIETCVCLHCQMWTKYAFIYLSSKLFLWGEFFSWGTTQAIPI